MIDWKFTQDSTIWVGKGNRKYRNILYRLESFKASLTSNRARKLIEIIQNLLDKPNQQYIRIFED